MLLLVSTSDRLQVITGSACTIDVHASWLDNVSGAVNPGRTNTNITTATTTDVVSPPAASVARNIKALHIRNRGASSTVVTVQHTDGVNIVQLNQVTLLAGKTLQYIDEIGFFGVVGGTAGLAINVVLFTASGTYTPSSPTLDCAMIECIGGGGGAGSAATGGTAAQVFQGGGGGSGGYSRKALSAATIGASQTVTIGSGGAGGIAFSTNNGAAGGITSFGSFCIANGGAGGVQSGTASAPTGGAGGTPGTGDVAVAGNGGGFGLNGGPPGLSVALCGNGGAIFGGMISTGFSGAVNPGPNGLGYGTGGSGGFVEDMGAASSTNGGNGANGVCIVTEYIFG